MEHTFPSDYSLKSRNFHQSATEVSFPSASCAHWWLADNAEYCTAGSYFMHGIKESSLGNVEDLYIYSLILIYSLFKALKSKDLNFSFLFLNAVWSAYDSWYQIALLLLLRTFQQQEGSLEYLLSCRLQERHPPVSQPEGKGFSW